MAVTTMAEKLAFELSMLYDAEHQFLMAQQEMRQQATESMVTMMLDTHINETQQQITNLEQVFDIMGQSPQRRTCQAATGMVNDARTALGEVAGNPQLIDGMILAAQAKVEHYEMACYRGVITGAQMMGQQEMLQLLQQNLQQEEKTADLVETHVQTLAQQTLQAHSIGG